MPVLPRYSPRYTGGFWVAGWSRGRGVCSWGAAGVLPGERVPLQLKLSILQGLEGLSINSPAICPISTGKAAFSLRRRRCSAGTGACSGSSQRCWIGAEKVAAPSPVTHKA